MPQFACKSSISQMGSQIQSHHLLVKLSHQGCLITAIPILATSIAAVTATTYASVTASNLAHRPCRKRAGPLITRCATHGRFRLRKSPRKASARTVDDLRAPLEHSRDVVAGAERCGRQRTALNAAGASWDQL